MGAAARPCDPFPVQTSAIVPIRRRPVKARGAAGWLLLGWLLAGGCGLIGAAEPVTPVRLQLKWHHQFQFAGYYAAQARGFFAAEGLAVEIIEGRAGRAPIASVLEGRAEYGVSDTDVLLARLRGQPIVVCAAIFQHSPYVIMSRADRRIRTPADLIGKKVMMADEQGAAQLQAMLAKEGIAARLVDVLPHSWNLADLIEGRVDAVSAYATVEPAQLRARGVEPALLRSVDYGVDFYGDTLFTTEDEVARHPARVDALIRATRQGWEYAFAHPEEIADLILRMEGVAARGITREQLLGEARAMRDFVLPEVVEIGHMNPGRWQQVADLLVGQGQAPGRHQLEGFIYDPAAAYDYRRFWWIPAGLGSLLLVVGGVILWNVQIRRQVRRRTSELQAEVASRQHAEMELRASEERFRQLAENINEVFWITDPAKQQVLYVSPAYEGIWGRTCASLYAAPGDWLAAVHPEDRARVLAAATTRQTTGGYDETYRILRPDGGTRWIHDRAFPVRDARGEVFRVVGTAEDITERRELEQRFLRAQRMESIGTLAGGIAHDFNNLLTPILMGVTVLKERAAGESDRRLIETIEHSARRGTQLVRQVLSFSREVEGARVAVSLRPLVGEIEGIVRNTFPKNIRFRAEFAPELSAVLGDATQLSQVLLNLCVNARDAMPDGGDLTIRAENTVIDEQLAAMIRLAGAGRYVLVTVSDTGTGMSPPVLDRIFEPFFTTKGPGQGTGLGLPTTLGLVRSHGGQLLVESEPGRGSTFRIYLPALQEAAVAAVVTAAERPRGRGELVLVVDDDTTILDITRHTLENFGYRVLTAEDGAQAISLYALQRDEIALVLTDMMMPVMDGAGLIKALRRINPGVRIVATSGIDGNEAVAAAAGVKQFLVKPFSADMLLTRLRQALD
jgi:two-component system cell cycle sensor histidine kinase/response regulator CckA